jgi:hypothetical protein
MAYSRRKSIVLNSVASQRVYRTFEDWQAEQLLDQRTPAERGIQVGSPVMWRHLHKKVIVTDRAIVLAIVEDTLTIRVKDVKERTCIIHVREVVNRTDDRLSLSMQEMNRNSYLSNQPEPFIGPLLPSNNVTL